MSDLLSRHHDAAIGPRVSVWEQAAVLFAGVSAGAINAVVGAGTLVTFGTLVALGVPSLTANVSNTVGLVAGSVAASVGYRSQLRSQRGRLLALAAPAVIGGICGATLLLVLPAVAFDAIVPVLVLLGVLLVAAQPWLAGRAAQREAAPQTRLNRARFGVYATAVYGGYFGAAQGVLLIAVLGTLVDVDLQRANAMKNVLAALVNAVAAVIFVFVAPVDWHICLLLVIGSSFGGLLASHFGQRLPAHVLRWVVIVVGLVAVVALIGG